MKQNQKLIIIFIGIVIMSFGIFMMMNCYYEDKELPPMNAYIFNNSIYEVDYMYGKPGNPPKSVSQDNIGTYLGTAYRDGDTSDIGEIYEYTGCQGISKVIWKDEESVFVLLYCHPKKSTNTISAYELMRIYGIDSSNRDNIEVTIDNKHLTTVEKEIILAAFENSIVLSADEFYEKYMISKTENEIQELDTCAREAPFIKIYGESTDCLSIMYYPEFRCFNFAEMYYKLSEDINVYDIIY